MSADTVTPEDPELGTDGRALIDSARAGLEPSDADRVRVRRSLAAAIAAGAAVATAGTTGSAAAASSGGLAALALKVGLAVVVLAVTGGGIAYVERTLSPEAEPHAAQHTRTTDATNAEARPAPATPRAQVTAPAVVHVAPVPPSTGGGELQPTAEAELQPTAPRARTLAIPLAPPPPALALPATPSATPIDELPAENALLRRAQAALAVPTIASAGEALAALDEHARRFPSGTLAEERDATRALALCAAGRAEEARTAARAFLAAHSSSPLAHRVRNACAL